MEDSKSYTALRTSRKSHFKSFNYSSHYYIWKKVSQSVDANISEIQGNSEATAGTEELKLLSTLKLKRTLCERGKEKKKQTSSPIRCTIHTYQREPHRRMNPLATHWKLLLKQKHEYPSTCQSLRNSHQDLALLLEGRC